MNCSIIIDGKFVVALGAALGIVILAVKADPSSAEKVLTNLVSAGKELTTVYKQF